jgi:hypothetical protein
MNVAHLSFCLSYTICGTTAFVFLRIKLTAKTVTIAAKRVTTTGITTAMLFLPARWSSCCRLQPIRTEKKIFGVERMAARANFQNLTPTDA